MCILEAGITKTPVISTKVGLCREILSDENAYIVDRSEDSIVSAIDEIKNNYSAARAKSQILYNLIISKFTYDTEAIDMSRIIDKNLKK